MKTVIDMVYVIASSRHWNERMPARISETTGQIFYYIDNVKDLALERLKGMQPRYIFFPHWSYIIPEEIYENFECVIFHMTDVPFGRGGSPLQNLIVRGIYETQISALRCEAELDSGPVYMKRSLSLYGGGEEIFLRASKIIEAMITEIVLHEPGSVPQQGEAVCFKRRKPSESDISELIELEQVFNHIRMLDVEGYPRAFLETDNLRLEFQRPSIKQGKIIADVIITKKGTL